MYLIEACYPLNPSAINDRALFGMSGMWQLRLIGDPMVELPSRIMPRIDSALRDEESLSLFSART